MTTKKQRRTRATKKIVESDVFKNESSTSTTLKKNVDDKKRTLASATRAGLEQFNSERTRLIEESIKDKRLDKFQAQKFFEIRRDCNIARRMIKQSFENKAIQKDVHDIAEKCGITNLKTCKLLSPESFDAQMNITIKKYKLDTSNQRTLSTEYWAGFVNAINALLTTSAHTSNLDCFIHVNGSGFRPHARTTPILIVNPKYAKLFKSIDSTIDSTDLTYINETIRFYKAK